MTKNKVGNWIDMRTKNLINSFDEKIVLRLWRICRARKEFIIGVFVGIAIILFIIK